MLDQNLGHQQGHRRRGGRRRWFLIAAALAMAAAIVAVTAFGVSPWIVLIAGMALLHPLMHTMGGHRHGGGTRDRGNDSAPGREGQQHGDQSAANGPSESGDGHQHGGSGEEKSGDSAPAHKGHRHGGCC